MTKEVIGYKWNNENAAQNAQNAAKAHFLSGRPANPQGYTTTEWFEAVHNTGVSGDFWYFIGDIAPVLGQPTTFDIDIDEDI